jgi:choline dehydrogenase-like flavoprotein
LLNWRFETAPQQDAGNRSIYVPRGRALGGSSSINGMVYIRGHPLDFDDWAAAGNPGWSYREVLPYFRKSENNEQFGGDPYHGKGGLLNVTNVSTRNRLDDIFLEAADSMQFRRCPDFNGADQEGFGLRQVTVRDGRRASTARAFLRPVRHRRNLLVLTDASVSRVMIAEGRATGVVARVDGKERQIGARREVILAAGTVASPMILLRSGIGDGAQLQALGIEPIRHRPEVGRNWQDHIAAAVQFTSPVALSYGLSARGLPRLLCSLGQYALVRRGLLASNVMQSGGFVRTDPALDRPDMQYVFLPAFRDKAGRIGRGHGYGLIAILLRPKSRGTIRLASADPDVGPVIDPQFFSDADDLEVLLRGVKLARRILAAPAFDRVRGTETAPGAEIQGDDGLRQFIRNTAATTFHAVGTCRMGADTDSVVDPSLRVRQIERLRVVDASVMPTLIGGNTNAPTIMIAEKAADLIRAA